jgi:beta-phosphoglucomutase
MKKLKESPRAIIFDMDGVIVDSMPYHFIAWYEALKPYGVRVSCFEVYTKEGERWDKTLKSLLASHKVDPTPKTLNRIFALRKKIFRKYFKRFIFKGADEFLACLKRKGYLLGLVTGTPTQEVNRILPKKIKKLFDCIVTGDHVKKGKPNPEPYLMAAKKLKTRPDGCVVVENAPLGIESAKSAGMFCVALTTSLPADYLGKADVVAEDLSQIPGIIDGACSI